MFHINSVADNFPHL